MNGSSIVTPTPPRRRWRSVGAVVAGFVVVFVLSVGTDQVLHVLKVYPPWGEPMAGALYGMATAYRIVYTILGGYITARLAPDAPVRHALRVGRAGTQRDGHVRDVPARGTTVLRPQRRPAVQVHSGDLVIRELRDAGGGGRAVEEVVGGR